MRLKLSLFFTIGALSFTNLLAQTSGSNDIIVTVEGLGADSVFLANYYGSRLYYSDTTVADINGRFVFKGKAFEECGKYAVVLPGPVFFDMMLSLNPWNSELQ